MAFKLDKFAKASLLGAKTVWLPLLREDSIVDNVELSREVKRSARVERPLSLKAVRRPVTYDDWASAEVASAETTTALANMMVVGGFVNRVEWGGRSERD